ncbi:hypothetical protein [Nonomuraea pusilla]|uniref:Uncharacterized protein n=1 Tax=Nonomuraea pusilla TaxID=46177 RepID=A0A1H8JXZ7_9ACTN|nr:hypothetical protein [Nonomuraea pusilla]SEN85471.1 hypothetical protein SAMN05660976_08467 [Nonomuraea pusilla]
MKRHKVTILPNAGGFGAHGLQVDGHDISRGVRSLTMSLDPGTPPRVDLEMALVEVQRMEFETSELYISESTREALITLGWTAPATDGPPAVVLPTHPGTESVVHMYGKTYKIVGWDCYGGTGDVFGSITLHVAPVRKQG